MKRQSVLWSLIFLALANCTETASEGENANSEVSASLQHISNSAEFLSLFPEISVDNLHIHSPCYKPNSEFEGKLIDSRFHQFFAFDKYLKSELDGKLNIFSCYKFKLSDRLTGLIARTPSQYSETSVDLFFWDNRAMKITKRMRMADAFGDGTWHFTKDAWLTDINHDKFPDLVTRKIDWWQDDVDATPNNPLGIGQEHQTDTVKVFLWVNNDFTRSNASFDTSKFTVADCFKRTETE